MLFCHFTQRTGSPVGPGLGLALVVLQARLAVLDGHLGILIPHAAMVVYTSHSHTLYFIISFID